VCDLETSRMGAPYIYDTSSLRVKNHQFTLIVKTLKNTFKKLAPTCFGPYIRPCSGGSWAPWTWSYIYGLNHVGASFLKVFLSVLTINVNWWFLKCTKGVHESE